MKIIIALIIVLLFAIGGGAYWYFQPAQVKKREAAAALESFAQAVRSKDRAQVTAALEQWLAEDAKITLRVQYFALSQAAARALVQPYPNRQGFVTFIDNILYSLQDYSYEAKISDFVLPPDGTSADIEFTSHEWGDGISMYGGVSVNMRYSSNTTCKTQVSFLQPKPIVQVADCVLKFRQVPKPGQTDKFNNMNSLQDLLKESNSP